MAGQSFATDNKPQHGTSNISKPPAYFLHMRNGLWFFRRHSHGLQRPVCLASFTAQALAFSVRLIFLGHVQAARAVWRGLVDGWSSLPLARDDGLAE